MILWLIINWLIDWFGQQCSYKIIRLYHYSCKHWDIYLDGCKHFRINSKKCTMNYLGMLLYIYLIPHAGWSAAAEAVHDLDRSVQSF